MIFYYFLWFLYQIINCIDKIDLDIEYTPDNKSGNNLERLISYSYYPNDVSSTIKY